MYCFLRDMYLPIPPLFACIECVCVCVCMYSKLESSVTRTHQSVCNYFSTSIPRHRNPHKKLDTKIPRHGFADAINKTKTKAKTKTKTKTKTNLVVEHRGVATILQDRYPLLHFHAFRLLLDDRIPSQYSPHHTPKHTTHVHTQTLITYMYK